ncbi:HNH endonuclease signature motif containing protein [Arthrobacter sp. SD76]|uniref:HNH endonuclease signature motif containing protein n=1 Tax=Arthrobacter sp. SD76 TaxID=3415007 RepID=UPI003C71DF60
MGRHGWDRGVWDKVPHSDLIFHADIFWTAVNKTESCWEWTAGKNKAGYGCMNVRKADGRKTTARTHKLSYLLHTGPIPDALDVDHTCHNRACVNPHHLRLATRKQNQENRGPLDVRNKSGYRGVHWAKAQKKWAATVSHNGKPVHVGYFSTAEAAGEAARAKRNELYTHNDLDRQEVAA